MATTVNRPPEIDTHRDSSRRSAELRNYGGGNGVPGNNTLHAVKNYSPPPASTGIWVVLASITMTFLAFTSALIVRQGSALDWHHLALPPILYFNTVVLFGSSFALQCARHGLRITTGGKLDQTSNSARWLDIALSLGILFVAGQYIAWLQLRSHGFYLATNPNSSFFYVLTGMHALHVLGGLGGLLRVIHKLRNSSLRKSTLDATAHYWHFMDGLWVYLLLLLWIKI